MIRVGSLFSGIGGWEFALRGKAESVFAVEYSFPVAQSFYANHRHKPIVSDIRAVDEKQWAPDSLDLLVASPPCPAYSKARKTTSERRADPDAGLEVLRFVDHLKPEAVAIENAPAYLASDVGQELIASLKGFGYKVWSGVLDAASYGTPQRRRRTIIRATRVHHTLVNPAEHPMLPWDMALAPFLHKAPSLELAPWQAREIAKRPPARYPALVVGGNPPEYSSSEGRRIWVPPGEPSPTLARASSVSGTRIMLERFSHQTPLNKHNSVGLTVEMAAVLSGFGPFLKDLDLPASRSAALNILGNVIPPPLARAALEGLL